MNIALFGGSFDPPHDGHKKIVEFISKKISMLDKIILMPCGESPDHKKYFFSAQERKLLLEQYFQHVTNLEISEYELLKKGTSYTWNTIKFLMNTEEKITINLVLGTDQAKNFSKWYKANEIATHCKLWTFHRGEDMPDAHFEWNYLTDIADKIDISSQEIKKSLEKGIVSNKISKDLEGLITEMLKRKII